MEFQKNIKKVRRFHRHTKNQMAARIGVSPETYRYFEEGTEQPCMSIFARILSEFKISNAVSFIIDPAYKPSTTFQGNISLFENKYQNLPELNQGLLNVIFANTNF